MPQRLPRANVQFDKLTNADLVTYGQAITDGLIASTGEFPAPPVTTSNMQSLVNDYSTALAASIGGSANQRATMHVAREALRTGIRQNAQYVNQVIAGYAAEGITYSSLTELILETGYQVGKQPAPAGPLPEPTIVKYSSPRKGLLYVLVQKIDNAKAYVLRYGISGSDTNTWETIAFPNTRINATGLTSGTTYQFLVYAQGASTVINSSDILTQVVI